MDDGRHFGGFKYRNRRNMNSSRSSLIWSPIFTALAGVIVKDLNSEKSKIKLLTGKLFHPKQIEKNQHKIIDAEYKIIKEEEKK